MLENAYLFYQSVLINVQLKELNTVALVEDFPLKKIISLQATNSYVHKNRRYLFYTDENSIIRSHEFV